MLDIRPASDYTLDTVPGHYQKLRAKRSTAIELKHADGVAAF